MTRLAAVLPIGLAVLMPLLPLLIVLADVLPPGVPLEGSRAFAVALAFVVPVVVCVAWIALLTRIGWAALWRPPLVAPLGAFIAAEIVAASSRLAPLSSLLAIVSQAVAALIYVACYWTLADAAVRRTFLACFFASGIGSTLFAIALVLTRHPPAAFAYLHGRAAGTFLQPNEFAGYLLFLIPLGIAQIGSAPWLKRLGLAAAVVGVAGLALSVSRAAWLGLIVGMPFLFARVGRQALLGYAIVAAAAIALSVLPMGIHNVAHDPSENASRIVIWRGAVRMVERFGLTGIGPAAFSRVYPAYKMPYAVADEVHSHDLPLNVLVEEGVIGFAAFLWLVGACVAQARRTLARISTDDRERLLLFGGLAAAFVASALQNMIDDVTTFVLILWWPMIGLMLSLGRESRPAGPDRSSSSERTVGQRRPLRACCVALMGLVAITSCSRTAAPAPPSPAASPTASGSAPNIASVTAHGTSKNPIIFQNIVNAHPVYSLKAASVTYLPNRQVGTFSDNQLVFYKGTAQRLTVTAPSAVLNLKTYDVVLRGGVKAVNANGDQLSADQIAYDGKAHQLLATGNVVAVDAAGTRITGDRAIADLDLQQIKIFGHINMSGGGK